MTKLTLSAGFCDETQAELELDKTGRIGRVMRLELEHGIPRVLTSLSGYQLTQIWPQSVKVNFACNFAQSMQPAGVHKVCDIGPWLVFKGTFSTKRQYRACHAKSESLLKILISDNK